MHLRVKQPCTQTLALYFGSETLRNVPNIAEILFFRLSNKSNYFSCVKKKKKELYNFRPAQDRPASPLSYAFGGTHQLQLREKSLRSPLMSLCRALTPVLARSQTDIHSWQVRQHPLLDHVTVASLGYHHMRKRRKRNGER